MLLFGTHFIVYTTFVNNFSCIKCETYLVFFKAMFYGAIHIDDFEHIVSFNVVVTLKTP